MCLLKFIFNDQIFTKSTKLSSLHLLSVFFTCQIMQIAEVILVDHNNTVCLHISLLMNECEHNQLGNLANTMFLLYALVKSYNKSN